MAITFPGSITGVVMSGFTAPTYTTTADVAPDMNGKQVAITALGGTQAGVTTHSVASPFTCTYVRPKVFKALGKANPVTNVISNVPRNIHTFLTRKGVTPLAGQAASVMIIRTTIEVVAGSDTADAPNVKAGIGCHFGAAYAMGAGIGDTALTGVM